MNLLFLFQADLIDHRSPQRPLFCCFKQFLIRYHPSLSLFRHSFPHILRVGDLLFPLASITFSISCGCCTFYDFFLHFISQKFPFSLFDCTSRFLYCAYFPLDFPRWSHVEQQESLWTTRNHVSATSSTLSNLSSIDFHRRGSILQSSSFLFALLRTIFSHVLTLLSFWKWSSNIPMPHTIWDEPLKMTVQKWSTAPHQPS